MANFYYTNETGTKQGPLTPEQLQALADRGIITPDTPLETDTGKQGKAGNLPGLKFNAAEPSPFAQPAQVTQNPATAAGKIYDYLTTYTPPQQPRMNLKRIGAFFSPSTIGIIAICFGLLDIGGTLVGLGNGYMSSWGMRYHSNKTYGSISNRNDVDSDKSEYLYEYAVLLEKFGRSQLWQRFQLDVIVICFGSFLVAYGSRMDRPVDGS